MKKLLKFIIFQFFVIILSGCALSAKKAVWTLPPKADDEISVMSFNVENLFDTVHDKERNDYTYLPLLAKRINPEFQKGCKESNESAYRLGECLSTDWNELQLDTKLKNLSRVVLGADGVGPDVLMLIEVENENVLKIWNSKYLEKAQYKTIVLIEGPDKRGIDVALMSRFPVVGTPVLHPIPWQPKNENDRKWMEGSRRILEVTLKFPNGDPVTFFVAHYPSQANPVYWRKQVAEFTATLMKNKGPAAMVIAGGDLNITAEEEDNEHLFRDTLGKAGSISHFIGCKGCPGTHNYQKSWSFLDAHIYSPSLMTEGAASYQVLPETIDVVRYDQIHLKKGKYPKRWDYERMDGVSDHFPLYVRLKQVGSAKTPVVEEVKSEAKKETKQPDKKATRRKKKK
jgi:endonuclease/exonuclease/phosphatase family metal-dependent hydrolase